MRKLATAIVAAALILLSPNSLHAATFGEVTEVYADNSHRNYVIRFLPDGRECLWSGPTVSNCPPGCLASSAPPVSLPSCLSLCSGGLNMVCPWD